MSDRDFDTFFRDRYPHLVAFVMQLGAHRHDAEEAAQDAMVAAYASWHRIDNPGAWTWRVACRSYLRLVRRRRIRELLVPDDRLYHRPDTTETDADVLWRDRVRGVLSRLADRQRRVVAMWLDGYRPEEIAGRLGIRPDTVRSLFRYARKRLATLFRDGPAEARHLALRTRRRL